ncbi:hypothetical protein K439DRAFT_323331 [Ramaria rubella]|nr:hypothetical protein K439DRAFT_323331 [Ramaria rubella]
MSHASHSETPSWSAPSSETLSVEEISLEDEDTTSSTLSVSSRSSTTICQWIPGGISGKILQALGPSTVDLVTRLSIKRRLSSISSEIHVRLYYDSECTASKALSEGEAEHLQAAYRDLVELSSGSYKAKVTNQAMALRLTILRAIIQSNRSCFDTYLQKRTLRNMWAELDGLASRALVTKITDELSGLKTHIHAKDLGVLLAGTHIVGILCHDLAYGTGGYAVQSALDRISCSSWGVAQLRRLNRQGDLVLDSARRLLLDFDNVYSRGMAFRIFGDMAVSNTTNSPRKLDRLLKGEHGLGYLIKTFDLMVQPTQHQYQRRFGSQCVRSMEALCTSLLLACCHGFMTEVVRQGLCPLLVELVELFNKRDGVMGGYIENDETEDPDIERDQIAACKLMLKLLDNEEALSCMVNVGAADSFRKFGAHSNRLFSDWDLKVLIDLIWQKLELGVANFEGLR